MALVYIMNKSKAAPDKINQLYICIFILFYLSAQDHFGRSLNVAYTDDLHLPDMPPVEGSVGDLLILAVYTLVRRGPRHLDSFSKILTGIICNL